MVQIRGAGVAPIVFKTCGNWGRGAWYISIVSISISSIVSQVEKAMSPWCRLSSCPINCDTVIAHNRDETPKESLYIKIHIQIFK